MRCPLKPLVAMLACAAMAIGIEAPLTPASLRSVASAEQPATYRAPANPTVTVAPAVTTTPTIAPPATTTVDPISTAKAILVAPPTFRPGGNTFLQAADSVGDEFVWKITGERFVMVGDGRKQAITFTEPDAADATEPFAVTLLVVVRDRATGVVTSVDAATAIVKPVGVAPPIVVAPSAPSTPTTPDAPPVVDPSTKATAAIYVYEKDQTAVSPIIMAAMNRLNRERKITATLFEQNATDGGGDVPEQYKIPLAKAKEAGLPALVVMAGSDCLRTVKNPTTEAAILEAAP